MQIKFVYKLSGILLLFIILQSRSGGPGSQQNLQVSGAPGDVGTCANIGCHGGGTYNPALSLTLLDGGNPVTSYQPGKTYTLRLVNTPATGLPLGYGFQAVSLSDNNNQSGTWGTLANNMQSVALGNKNYAEHSSPSASGTFNLSWIAPSSGSGKVTFYSASLAANLDGSTFGDAVATSTLTVSEGNVTSTEDLFDGALSMRILSNPVSENLNIEIRSSTLSNLRLSLMNVQGIQVYNKEIQHEAGSDLISIDLSRLTQGVYAVRLHGNGRQMVERILKL